MKVIYPAKLKLGDEIRVIAPARSIALLSDETLNRAIEDELSTVQSNKKLHLRRLESQDLMICHHDLNIDHRHYHDIYSHPVIESLDQT